MVLNYKDSIKAEMSLSAMLGKNVDLSQVRAKFASGDTTGAMESLRAQGLDPSQMNMFQQQQLQQATGGMDLNTLKKIATPGFQEGVGTVGTLEEKSAKASNEAFLALKQNSAAALATQEALISGQKAVQDAALSAIKDVTLKSSDAYKQYLTDLAQLDIERMFSENLGGAIAAGLGGMLGNFLPDIFKKMMPGGGGTGGAGGGGIMKSLTGPMSKVAKVGGSAVGGLLSGGMAFMEKKEEGGSTGEAAGAALLQGGLAAGGAALGAAFGGPLGMMVGGFLGDTLGGWINDYAPGVAENFGKLWDSVGEKFSAIGDAFRPVIENVDNFLKSIGFDEGLGSIFSMMAEYVGTTLMQPFNMLLAQLGFIFDIFTALGQLLSGDFTGAWQTVKQGFFDMIHGVLSPMVGLFETIYNGFAKLWNGIADSYIGEQLGLGKMEQKDFEAGLAKVTNQTETTATKSVAVEQQKAAAVEANKSVVAATTANTKVAEESAAHQAAMEKEMTYTGNAQSKMVALLGASAGLLEEIAIMTAAAAGKEISLDGKVLNKKLFDISNKTYGVART
jgi:hypothetical protein